MTHTTETHSPLTRKLQSIVRRGLPSLRNVLLSSIDVWPTGSLRGHWLADTPIYCISLSRAHRRRKLIRQQAKSMGLRRVQMVDAVDASALSLDDLIRDGRYDDEESRRWHPRGLSLNEVACSLSHIECYRRMLAAGDELALIIEDDALFRTSRIRRLSEQDLPLWADIVFLNAFYLSTPPADHLGNQVYGDADYAGSAAAYLVRRSTATRLLEAALPVVHAADGLLGRALIWDHDTPHAFRQRGCTLKLRAAMVYPEAVTNGSTEHYYRSSLR